MPPRGPGLCCAARLMLATAAAAPLAALPIAPRASSAVSVSLDFSILALLAAEGVRRGMTVPRQAVACNNYLDVARNSEGRYARRMKRPITAKRAIARAGNVSALARLFTPPLTRQAVQRWKRTNSIPEDRIAQLTQLRPEWFAA